MELCLCQTILTLHYQIKHVAKWLINFSLLNWMILSFFAVLGKKGAPQIRVWFVFVLEAMIRTTEIVCGLSSLLRSYKKGKKKIKVGMLLPIICLSHQNTSLILSPNVFWSILLASVPHISWVIILVSWVLWVKLSQLISSTKGLCDGLTSCYVMAPDQTNQFMGTMIIILAAQACYSRTAAWELKLPVREARERGN